MLVRSRLNAGAALGLGTLLVFTVFPHASAGAVTPAQVTTLDASAAITMERAAEGLSLQLRSEETNLIGYTSVVAATPFRYDEELTMDNGKKGRVAVDQEQGFVSANLIPLPAETLRAARLSPDSFVSFTLGKDDIGGLSNLAQSPALRMTRYLNYSPAGMWESVAQAQRAGSAILGEISTAPSPLGGTRYSVPVVDPGNASNTYTLDIDISPEGLMTYSRAYAPDIYSYTVEIIEYGASIPFPAVPDKMRAWEVIDAAKWRIAITPQAVSIANKVRKQIVKDFSGLTDKAKISRIRAQALAVAKATKISGVSVRAWNIDNGSRVELRRNGSTKNIWSTGACITLVKATPSVKAC